MLAANTVLLTQDAEFLDVPLAPHEFIIVSRVPQVLPLPRRIELWVSAAREYVQTKPREQLFEILPDGRLLPWEIRDSSLGE